MVSHFYNTGSNDIVNLLPECRSRHQHPTNTNQKEQEMHTKQPITKKINVTAAAAWDAISKIGRLDIWFPILDTCRVEGTGPGARRYMTIANNGGEIQDVIMDN